MLLQWDLQSSISQKPWIAVSVNHVVIPSSSALCPATKTFRMAGILLFSSKYTNFRPAVATLEGDYPRQDVKFKKMGLHGPKMLKLVWFKAFELGQIWFTMFDLWVRSLVNCLFPMREKKLTWYKDVLLPFNLYYAIILEQFHGV